MRSDFCLAALAGLISDLCCCLHGDSHKLRVPYCLLVQRYNGRHRSLPFRIVKNCILETVGKEGARQRELAGSSNLFLRPIV